MKTKTHTSAIRGLPNSTAKATRAFVRTCTALVALGCSAAAIAVPHEEAAKAQARYERDRAACLSGQTNQDRATCMREAGAALQAARRGKLIENEAAYEHNRFLRCNPLPPEDKRDCIRRMNGEGIVHGSVEGGGIYRELRTIVPAPADSVPSARR